MHEQNFVWRSFRGVMDEGLASRMCAELELLDVAADLLPRFIGIKRYLAAYARVTQNPGGRFRICISHKENRVDGILNDSSSENIRERFRDHHAARENVHAAAAYGRIAHRFIV